MRSIAWNLYLALAVFVGQYYFVSSVSSEPDSTVYAALSLTGIVAVIVGIAINRPRHKAGWFLIAASLAAYVAGDLVYSSLEADSVFVEFPSIADALYLAMYPLMAGGMMLVRRSLAPGRNRLATIDAALVGVSALLVLGVLYMNAFLTDDFFDFRARVVAVAYPVLDAVLVAMGVRLLLSARPIPATLWFLAVGIGSITIGNAVYNVQAAEFAFESGGLADLGWLAFTTLVGVAALHPSMAQPSTPVDASAGAEDPARLVGAVLSALLGPAVYLIWGESDGRIVAATAVAAIVMLLVVRSRLDSETAVDSTVAHETSDVSAADESVERELVSA